MSQVLKHKRIVAMILTFTMMFCYVLPVSAEEAVADNQDTTEVTETVDNATEETVTEEVADEAMEESVEENGTEEVAAEEEFEAAEVPMAEAPVEEATEENTEDKTIGEVVEEVVEEIIEAVQEVVEAVVAPEAVQTPAPEVVQAPAVVMGAAPAVTFAEDENLPSGILVCTCDDENCTDVKFTCCGAVVSQEDVEIDADEEGNIFLICPECGARFGYVTEIDTMLLGAYYNTEFTFQVVDKDKNSLESTKVTKLTDGTSANELMAAFGNITIGTKVYAPKELQCKDDKDNYKKIEKFSYNQTWDRWYAGKTWLRAEDTTQLRVVCEEVQQYTFKNNIADNTGVTIEVISNKYAFDANGVLTIAQNQLSKDEKLVFGIKLTDATKYKWDKESTFTCKVGKNANDAEVENGKVNTQNVPNGYVATFTYGTWNKDVAYREFSAKATAIATPSTKVNVKYEGEDSKNAQVKVELTGAMTQAELMTALGVDLTAYNVKEVKVGDKKFIEIIKDGNKFFAKYKEGHETKKVELKANEAKITVTLKAKTYWTFTNTDKDIVTIAAEVAYKTGEGPNAPSHKETVTFDENGVLKIERDGKKDVKMTLTVALTEEAAKQYKSVELNCACDNPVHDDHLLKATKTANVYTHVLTDAHPNHVLTAGNKVEKTVYTFVNKTAADAGVIIEPISAKYAFDDNGVLTIAEDQLGEKETLVFGIKLTDAKAYKWDNKNFTCAVGSNATNTKADKGLDKTVDETLATKGYVATFRYNIWDASVAYREFAATATAKDVYTVKFLDPNGKELATENFYEDQTAEDVEKVADALAATYSEKAHFVQKGDQWVEVVFAGWIDERAINIAAQNNQEVADNSLNITYKMAMEERGMTDVVWAIHVEDELPTQTITFASKNKSEGYVFTGAGVKGVDKSEFVLVNGTVNGKANGKEVTQGQVNAQLFVGTPAEVNNAVLTNLEGAAPELTEDLFNAVNAKRAEGDKYEGAYTDYKIVWYVQKLANEKTANKCWHYHVDGVIVAKASENITIKYVDVNGNVIATQSVMNVMEGTEREVELQAPTGYRLAEGVTTKTVKYGDGEQEVLVAAIPTPVGPSYDGGSDEWDGEYSDGQTLDYPTPAANDETFEPAATPLAEAPEGLFEEEFEPTDVALAETPELEEEFDENETPLGDAPATGDSNHAIAYAAMGMVAVAGMVATRKEEEN